MRRNSTFTSAAGNIRFPMYRASGSIPQAVALNMNLDMGQCLEIPSATRLDVASPIPPVRTTPDVKIEDVSTFSKNAIRQEAPEMVLLTNETDNEIDAYYSSQQFQVYVRKPADIAVRLQLPPQVRKKPIAPTVKILGVPDDW